MCKHDTIYVIMTEVIAYVMFSPIRNGVCQENGLLQVSTMVCLLLQM